MLNQNIFNQHPIGFNLSSYLNSKDLNNFILTGNKNLATSKADEKLQQRKQDHFYKKAFAITADIKKRSKTQSLAGNHFDRTTCFISPDQSHGIKSHGIQIFYYQQINELMLIDIVVEKKNNNVKRIRTSAKPSELFKRVYILISNGYTVDYGCLKDWRNKNIMNRSRQTYHYYQWDEPKKC